MINPQDLQVGDVVTFAGMPNPETGNLVVECDLSRIRITRIENPYSSVVLPIVDQMLYRGDIQVPLGIINVDRQAGLAEVAEFRRYQDLVREATENPSVKEEFGEPDSAMIGQVVALTYEDQIEDPAQFGYIFLKLLGVEPTTERIQTVLALSQAIQERIMDELNESGSVTITFML